MKTIIVEDINRIREIMGLSLITEAPKPIKFTFKSELFKNLDDADVSGLNIRTEKINPDGSFAKARNGQVIKEKINSKLELDERILELEGKSFDELSVRDKQFVRELNKKIASVDPTYVYKLAEDFNTNFAAGVTDPLSRIQLKKSVEDMLGDQNLVREFNKNLQEVNTPYKNYTDLEIKQEIPNILDKLQKSKGTPEELALLQEAKSRNLLEGSQKNQYEVAMNGTIPGITTVAKAYDDYRAWTKLDKKNTSSFETWFGQKYGTLDPKTQTYKLPSGWDKFFGVGWSKLKYPFELVFGPNSTPKSKLVGLGSIITTPIIGYFAYVTAVPFTKGAKKGIDLLGKKLEVLADPSRDQIESALEKYFKYSSPKVIKGESVISEGIYNGGTNTDLRNNIPSFQVFGKGEDMYVELSKPIVLNGEQKNKFRVLIPTVEFEEASPVVLELIDSSNTPTQSITYVDKLDDDGNDKGFKSYVTNELKGDSKTAKYDSESGFYKFNNKDYVFKDGTFKEQLD